MRYDDAMIAAHLALDSCPMGKPVPIDEVAQEFRVSRRTMFEWAREFGLTKYHVPGQGKLTHLDPDEVRRKVKPRVVRRKSDPPAEPAED
jgi:hypothetical protein